MNYELDEVLSVKVCQARMVGLDSCRVGQAMTVIMILYMFNTQMSEQTGCTSVMYVLSGYEWTSGCTSDRQVLYVVFDYYDHT